jgi:hypothetical protein
MVRYSFKIKMIVTLEMQLLCLIIDRLKLLGEEFPPTEMAIQAVTTLLHLELLVV